jgi:hypothetical protein
MQMSQRQSLITSQIAAWQKGGYHSKLVQIIDHYGLMDGGG